MQTFNEQFAGFMAEFKAARGLDQPVGTERVQVQPKKLHPELRAAYVSRLTELQGKIDQNYKQSDDYRVWEANQRIAREIAWLEKTLASYS